MVFDYLQDRIIPPTRENIDELMIPDEYRTINSLASSPKGNKVKYHKHNMWYKRDVQFKEVLVSELLEHSTCKNFLKYDAVYVNGMQFCESKTAWSNEITIDKIFRIVTGQTAGDYLYRY